jgi:phosphate starvation-inducible PhoH-like protein
VTKTVVKRAAKRASRPNPREDRNNHVRLVTDEYQPKVKLPSTRIDLIPRNLNQEVYVDYLTDENTDIVFGIGPAGCGKTYLAVLYAIKQLREGNIEKIIVTRPLVANGENIGALPGDLIAKLSPWAVPVLDIFKKFYTVPQVKRMLEEETLELAALGLMRGRSIENAVILGDEMQNATPDQCMMLMTRIGEGSKLIITGDVAQHDRGFEKNGLKDVIPRFLNQKPEHINMATFSQNDIERHRVIGSVLDLYNK